MKTKKNEGITLIALVITIIVLLILAGVSIAVLTGDSGIFSQANEAKFKNEITAFQEQLQLFKTGKIAENNGFSGESLNASKELIQYNTKKETETGNIKTVIPSLKGKQEEKVSVIKGELVYNTKSEQEIKWLQELGITPNPYEIVDGELKSSYSNLMLMDSTGTLTIPGNVTKIGEGAFANLEGLKKIIIPGTCKEIGVNAFANNSTLETVIMEKGVETIRDSAFQSCRNLTTVEMVDSIISMGTKVFMYDSNLKEINIPKKIDKIKAYTFYQCKQIKKIEIPEGVKTIEDAAFGESGLEVITFPKTLTTIGITTFQRCDNLKDIIIAKENQSFSFENGILFNQPKTVMLFISSSTITGDTFIVPETVISLTSRLLINFPNITKVIIPASVSNINYLFFNEGINTIIIDSNNENYMATEEAVYTKDKKTLVHYFAKKEDVQLEEGIEVLAQSSFVENSTVKTITLPNTLKEIGNQTFAGKCQISNLNIGKNVETISPLFVYGKSNIKVTIDPDNQHFMVENNTLFNKEKTKLITIFNNPKEYTIPNGVKEIGNLAFHNKSINSIMIPNTVERIENSFNYCNNLTKIEIPSSVNYMNSQCFENSNSLKEIIIHKEKDSIAGAPWRCVYGEKAITWQP